MDESRRARVELRELYGKVPDDRVDELIDRLRAVLFVVAADNRLRRDFRAFGVEFVDDVGERGAIRGSQPPESSPIGDGGMRVDASSFAALLDIANPRSDEFIAVVPGRLERFLTRRAAVLFVEHRDGTALEITVPFYVRPPRTTKYSPARVRLVPRRLRPSSTPTYRGGSGLPGQPAKPALNWPGWLKRT